MKRWIGPGLAVIAALAAGWLWRDNRRLRAELAARAPSAADPWRADAAAAPDADAGGGNRLTAILGRRKLAGSGPRPTLDPPAPESRLERRLRRQERTAELLGRGPDESEADYKARVLPLLDLMIGGRRAEVVDLRRSVEEAAGVTDAQRAELDAAFEHVYDEAVAFTNTAIADGSLTPYERNVTGAMQVVGGLGSILEGAQGRIGSILRPEQVQAIAASGFEWGEYLALTAPWNRLSAPPPRPQ
ncbi:MAG: hypothetical protein R3B06_29065 [Kofleriaceae bacterium]